MMRVNRLSVAGFLALAMTFAWVGATTASTLTLTGPAQGNVFGPQSTSNPCIIAGTQCQQPAGFGFNNFTQSGNIASYNMFSTDPTANVADGVQGTPYTVGQIDGITNNQPFSVAIDVNTTGAKGETLQLFEVIVNGAVVYNYVGPTVIGGIANNGNGFGDWTLGVIDLSAFADSATVLFHAVWNNASDGAESFFILTSPVPVPEPSSLLLGGTVLLGLGYSLRNRIFRRRSQELTAS